MENKEIWKRLRDLREEKGLTYHELSKELNIKYGNDSFSESTLKAYESTSDKNRRELTKRAIINLSEFYNVSPLYLLDKSYTNKSDINISINKELGLSDITISKIKEIKNKDSLNLLFENLNYGLITFYLEHISVLKEYYNICSHLIALLEEKTTKEELYNFINSIDKKYIDYVFYYDLSEPLSIIQKMIKEFKSIKSLKNFNIDTSILFDYLVNINDKIGYYKYEIFKCIINTLEEIFEEKKYI